MTTPSIPPKTTERLLESLGAEPEFRDALLGDLAEEHALRAAYDGDRAARRWYRREALRIAPHLLRDWARGLRGRDVARLAAVVLAAYVCGSAVNIGSSYLGWDIPRLLFPGGPPGAGAALAALLAQNAFMQMLGGYVAAALDRRRPLIGALAFGAAFAALHLVAPVVGSQPEGWPAWLYVARAALVVAAATLGGVLRVYTRRPASR